MTQYRTAFFVIACTLLCAAQVRQPTPGWNLFSVQQDEQLGKEASQQVYQKMQVVRNQGVDDYLARLLDRLKQSREARFFAGTEEPIPYTIHAVADKNINAFSLPGGPIFINTGLFAATDSEAELAGVIAHEMSHVVLRHATNQVTKRNLLSLPAILAGAVVGNGVLGQLAQVGVGLGANSVLLGYSRSAESQADYNGAIVMSDAGYNPIEMAHFFEKLEAQAGSNGRLSQFLSDHPNPGNRVRAVEDEIRQMASRNYSSHDSGDFARTKDLISHLAPPGQLQGVYGHDGHPTAAPLSRPSGQYREYRGKAFSLRYPDNWQVFGDQQSNALTIAPPQGIVKLAKGQVAIGYGIQTSYYFPQSERVDLNRDTEALVQQMIRDNAGSRVAESSRSITVGDQPALKTVLTGASPYEKERETDTLITVVRNAGLFYMVFIVPQSENGEMRRTFEDVLRSVSFR